MKENMSQDKTLPGAPFRFASVSSSGSHINAFGVGEMSLGMYRPGNYWPQVDLGQIYFSAPTPDQYEEATKLKGSITKEACNFSDIHRRISRKQAEYVTYLIVSMLSEKLKGEMPTDDEIDIIMKEAREANYPVNREKREAEKKWELTKEQTRLLGELRAKAASKNIPISLCFELSTHGYIAFTRPGGRLYINFTVGEGERDDMSAALGEAIYQIEQVKNPEQPTQAVDDQKQLEDLAESTRVRCQMNYDRAMSEAVQQVSDLKDLKN